MAEKQSKVQKQRKEQAYAREAFRRERKALQQAQFARDAKAKRRAIVNQETGIVENVISADDDFVLPGKMIVDWADSCEIGGRYEDGKFIKLT